MRTLLNFYKSMVESIWIGNSKAHEQRLQKVRDTAQSIMGKFLAYNLLMLLKYSVIKFGAFFVSLLT